MRSRLRDEWLWLRTTVQRIDAQTAVMLTVCVALVFLQLDFGGRRFFRENIAPALELDPYGVWAWAWWFGIQGVTGFVLPVALLMLVFKQRLRDIGLGLGDWRLAGTIALIYAPIVTIGTWVLSNDQAFQDKYPHFDNAQVDWGLFLAYELLYLFYWIGWEYLWRGFVLFGTARTFGFMAVFVQMVPFALLHADKPPAEAYLSILGGIALGALCWRCRSFWIAVPIHSFQMLALDFWCTLRFRTGVDGIGPGALWETFRTWLGG
ncbi:MAG: CPBP family intramembrane glutamic endopeptidase [Bacteroidota bacterium]